ncbi:hypothetical protein [Lacinutrix sp. MEBiC02404]
MNKLLVSVALLLVLSVSFTSCRETAKNNAPRDVLENAAEAVEAIRDSVKKIEDPWETVTDATENPIGYPVESATEETVIKAGGAVQNPVGNTNSVVKSTTGSPVKDVVEEVFEEVQVASSIKPEDYKVVLSVDGAINKNETGMMQVWIGASKIKPFFSDGMVQDETTVPSNIGSYAKITPVASDSDFEIVYLTDEKCYKIHPSGSDVRFLLKPKRAGTYKVSANVEIFRDSNCSGEFVPKTSKTLSVIVAVDIKKDISTRIQVLLDIIWEKFLTFWGALIAFIFAVLFFLIKRRIKRKTDYEESED